MTENVVRTQIVVPESLLASVDQLVGRRKRSKFFSEAVAEKLASARLRAAARNAAGSLRDVDVPGWQTSQEAVAWVRSSGQADEEELRRRLASS